MSAASPLSGIRHRGRALPWGLVCVVLGVTAVLVARSSVGPADFMVYRYAAERALAGGNVYSGNLTGPLIAEGGLPFTYPPFALALLMPTTLFEAWTAYLLWSALSVGIVALAVDHMVPRTIRARAAVVPALVVALSFTVVVTEHVSFGQVNLILMALVLLDTVRSADSRVGRRLPPGLLVGVAAAVKLTPALFIAYFVVSRQWRRALWSSVGAAGATVVGVALFPAMSWDFWTGVVWSLDSRVDVSGRGLASDGNDSVTGLIAAAGPALNPVVPALVALLGAAAIAAAAAVHRSGRPLDAVLVVGLTAPALSPVSWTHHWVYLVPALAVLAVRSGARVRALLLVGFVSLVVGPHLGDTLLQTGPAWLAPLAWAQRECLLLASVTCVALLAHRPPQAVEDGELSAPPPTRAEFEGAVRRR